MDRTKSYKAQTPDHPRLISHERCARNNLRGGIGNVKNRCKKA